MKTSHSRVFNILTRVSLFLATLVVLSGPAALAASTCGDVFRVKSSRDLPLISMDAHYRGEDRGLYIDPVTKRPWQVKYFTETEKRSFELVIKDKLLWTADGKKAESEYDGEALSFTESLIVVDKDLRIFALPFEERGKYHHSSLTRGKDILFAGTVAFSGGRIRQISDNSGHYKPSVEQTLLILKELKKMGVDMSAMSLTGRAAKALGNTYLMSPRELAPLLQD